MIRALKGTTPKIAASAFISEAAYVVGDVEIGENSSVWPGAVIRGDMGRIKIGRDTVVEDNCVIHSGTPSLSSLTSDVVIGDRVQMGHGAVFNGRKIENNVLIGINATVLHDAEIGNFCIIGAACLVGQGMKVPDNSLVIGVPGQIRRITTENQQWWVEEGYKSYLDLARQYKGEGL